MNIKVSDLEPFVDSLDYTTKQYFHGEEVDNFNFRNRILMFAVTAIWHVSAKPKVQFDTYMGEYLALMQDDPPMTEWIIDWHDNIIPKMLKELRQLLESDHSKLSSESIKDISASAEHLTEFCLPKADTPEKLAELWQAYKLTRGFFIKHRDSLSAKAKTSIDTIEKLNPEQAERA